MTTNARIGYGSKFYLTDYSSSPGTLTKIAEVTNISPPNEQTDIIDATHMESPNAYREFVMGLSDGGEASFDMNFEAGSASEQLILASKERSRAENLPTACRIEFPNNAVWDFNGHVTGYQPSVPVDDKMTATVTIKVTGSIAPGQAT